MTYIRSEFSSDEMGQIETRIYKCDGCGERVPEYSMCGGMCDCCEGAGVTHAIAESKARRKTRVVIPDSDGDGGL